MGVLVVRILSVASQLLLHNWEEVIGSSGLKLVTETSMRVTGLVLMC